MPAEVAVSPAASMKCQTRGQSCFLPSTVTVTDGIFVSIVATATSAKATAVVTRTKVLGAVGSVPVRPSRRLVVENSAVAAGPIVAMSVSQLVGVAASATIGSAQLIFGDGGDGTRFALYRPQHPPPIATARAAIRIASATHQAED